jgi:PadR family transcriptional regulator, regulatory protein PadR
MDGPERRPRSVVQGSGRKRVKCFAAREFATQITKSNRALGPGPPPLHIDKRGATVPVEAKGEPMTEPTEAQGIDLPQGTLDLLILRTLAPEPQHGWAISERIHQVSSKVLQVRQGSLYPALHRLERRGWIKAHWGASENNRKAKYYELTKNGRKQLETEKSEWLKLAAAVAQVLETT